MTVIIQLTIKPMQPTNEATRNLISEVERLLRRRGRPAPLLIQFLHLTQNLSEDERELLLRVIDPFMSAVNTRWIIPRIDEAVKAVARHIVHESRKPLQHLDVADVAHYLKVSERTVERLIARGLIRPLWIGTTRRFSKETIDAFLVKHAIRGRQSI